MFKDGIPGWYLIGTLMARALTRRRVDGYQNYQDAIPHVFTTLPCLQEYGPLANVLWRCGHRQ
jgi:hypothetical protein